MSLKKLISEYARYNAWANNTLIDYIRSKPEQTWYAEVPSSFSSLVKTANHILATEEYWHSVITQTPPAHTRHFDEDPGGTEVFEALVRQSEALEKLVDSYTPEELEASIEIINEWFSCASPRYIYLQHLFNHSTYHRGQLVTIGRALGFTDAPMTDLNYMLVMRESTVL